MISRIFNKFLNLWRSSDRIGQQAARGGALVFFERIAIKAIQFVKTVVIARLLFPEDFGLFGFAMLAIAVSETLVQTGFNSAIIQEKGDVKKYLDNAWTVNVIRGIALALILFFIAAPLAGNFFHAEEVILFIQVLALVALLSSFENIGIILLQKEMQFQRQFFYSYGGVVIETIMVIVGAYILRSPWALVVGVAAGRMTFLVLSYLLHPYRPKLNFDFSGAWHLFKYGKWISITGIITFFATQGDNIVVGRMLNESALGFYQLAFALGTLPAVEVGRVLGKVLFPLYTKMHAEEDRLKSAFLKASQMVFLIAVPASAGLFILAPEIVRVVYGARWLPMVPVLYVIVIYGFLKSIEATVLPLLLGTGKPYVQTSITVLQLAVMFSLIIPFTGKYGAVGAASAATLGVFSGQVLLLYYLKRYTQFSARTFVYALGFPVLGSIIMCGAIIGVKHVIVADHVLVLASFILFGALLYSGSIFLFDRMGGGKIYESIIWIKKNI